MVFKRRYFKFFLCFFLYFLPLPSTAQELYPLAEPASSIPKNTLGIRVFSETFKEWEQWRNVTGLRFMYGLTPKLSVFATALGSNHHGLLMPEEFPFHNTPERGKIYPYKFNGGHLYAKYRFLSLDKQNEHFRMAAFVEGSYVKTTHHETEPDLEMADNSGFGFGWIQTYLKNKWAISLTLGAIFPAPYIGYSPDPFPGLPEMPIKVHYGKTLTYHLSMGYLILPRTYKSYDQGNLNVYLSLHGKYYDAAKAMVFYGEPNAYYLEHEQYPIALQRGWFVDISPGIQYIVKSNLRIDFSLTMRGLGFSYARLYPLYTVGIQRYFYF